MPTLTFNAALPRQLFPRFRSVACRRTRNPAHICRQRKGAAAKCLADSFEEAIQKGYVKDFGRVNMLNADLSFSPSSELAISPKWKPAVEKTKHIVVHYFGKHQLRSMLVRGSVASGFFLEHGASDFDIVIFTREAICAARLKEVKIMIQEKVYLNGVSLRQLRIGIDLRCIHDGHHISWSESIVLSYYSIAVYGSIHSLAEMQERKVYEPSLSIDIRQDERACLNAFERGKVERNKKLQVAAVQWLCKRCLRALTEMAVNKTRKHARELAPCFKLCAQAYPSDANMLLRALQIACANETNGYSGLGECEKLISMGLSIGRNVVEMIEEQVLYELFDGVEKVEHLQIAPALRKRGKFDEFAKSVGERAEQGVARVISAVQGGVNLKGPFRRYELPVVLVEGQGKVEEGDVELVKTEGGRICLTEDVCEVERPIVFRGVVQKAVGRLADWKEVLQEMGRNHVLVECRFSESNEFSYCSDKHGWIEEGRFSAPSEVGRVTMAEAMDGLRGRYEGEGSGRKGHTYVQTETHEFEGMFTSGQMGKFSIAQRERMWVSAHGTVSGLHYDGAFSALVQRSGWKRMLLFAPERIREMQTYPRGHPLHRRARVGLDRRDSDRLGEFWREGGGRGCVEVEVRAGDILVFPPFWSHYTESWSSAVDGGGVLSICHTLRYV